VLQSGNQDRVFEHIGMVARVKGMAITEHGAMVTSIVPIGTEAPHQQSR
jgi:hypothetical protein